MFGCESILEGEPIYSVFPFNYTVYRKDRNSAGGGVFIAIKDIFISYPLNEVDTNCEIVWASLQLKGCKKLIFASYYGPPKSNEMLMKLNSFVLLGPVVQKPISTNPRLNI